MKLSDIFSLNLNSKGGAKLFNKIANKYNLIKSDRKDLIKVVNKGGNSLDVIYVGVKKPFSATEDISDINDAMMCLTIGLKYTEACCSYINWSFGYEGYQEKEYVIAYAIPIPPEFPNSLENYPVFSNFSQLRLMFVNDGFTEEEFDSNFYEISREEFFTPSPETIDKLTLEFDNHKLIVDFAKNIYEKDGVVSEITNSEVPKFTGLTSVTHDEIVCNNVKYETNTNNYVEYYNRFSSDVYCSGRIKVNGVGPDPNYGDVSGADGYRHSSGIIVRVIE